MDWQLMIPGTEGIPPQILAEAREVRLRCGAPAAVCTGTGTAWGTRRLTAGEVVRAAQALSGHALAARQREIARGFLPLPGGHRPGVCGVMGPEGLWESPACACAWPGRNGAWERKPTPASGGKAP